MAPPSLDMPPPWQVFPAMTPQQLGATQGAEEQWFDGMWRPYWQSLDAAGQEACHARWNTSPAWRESIAFFCRAMSEAELAEDARESAEAANRMKSDFLASMSHELRTPLALILGPVDQLIKDGTGLGERERFRLAAIQRNARSLLQQVNNLLDLARIEQHHVKPVLGQAAQGLIAIAHQHAGVAQMLEHHHGRLLVAQHVVGHQDVEPPGVQGRSCRG